MRAALLESVFDPRERSPFSVVVGLRDPGYAETKAIELITEAKLTAVLFEDHPEEASRVDVEKLRSEYNEKIAQAISLLALARVQRNGAAEDQVEKKA